MYLKSNQLLIDSTIPILIKIITHYKLLACLFALYVLLISCDSKDHETSIDKDNTLITLSPHLTELAISAGAIDNLIGRVSFPGDTAPHLKDISTIGDAFKLDYETIVSLNPDYILSWDGGTPVSMVNKLKSLNFDVIEISIDKLSDIPQAIAKIAHLTKTEQYAQANINTFNQQLTALKTQNTVQKSAFIQTYHQPLYTVSSKHWMSEAAQVCGFHNIFEDLSTKSAAVSLESVISINPQTIIIIGNKNDLDWSQWPDLSAVKDENIIELSPHDFAQPSMQILAGIKKLCGFNNLQTFNSDHM